MHQAASVHQFYWLFFHYALHTSALLCSVLHWSRAHLQIVSCISAVAACAVFWKQTSWAVRDIPLLTLTSNSFLYFLQHCNEVYAEHCYAMHCLCRLFHDVDYADVKMICYDTVVQRDDVVSSDLLLSLSRSIVISTDAINTLNFYCLS